MNASPEGAIADLSEVNSSFPGFGYIVEALGTVFLLQVREFYSQNTQLEVKYGFGQEGGGWKERREEQKVKMKVEFQLIKIW